MQAKITKINGQLVIPLTQSFLEANSLMEGDKCFLTDPDENNCFKGRIYKVKRYLVSIKVNEKETCLIPKFTSDPSSRSKRFKTIKESLVSIQDNSPGFEYKIFFDRKNQDFFLFVKSKRAEINWSGHCIAFDDVNKIVHEKQSNNFPFLIK